MTAVIRDGDSALSECFITFCDTGKYFFRDVPNKLDRKTGFVIDVQGGKYSLIIANWLALFENGRDCLSNGHFRIAQLNFGNLPTSRMRMRELISNLIKSKHTL